MPKQQTLAQQLGIGDDPVQPPAFSRANLQLRPSSVRGGGWRPAVPGTLSASETSLGRLASALSETSGLLSQVTALKAKKAELEERGLVATHQTAMGQLQLQIGNEKLTQLSNSLDTAEEKTQEATDRANWEGMTEEERQQTQKNIEDYAVEQERLMTESRNNVVAADAQENGPGTRNQNPVPRKMVSEAFLGSRAADSLRADVLVEIEKIQQSKDENGNPIELNEEEFAGVVSGVVARIKQEKGIKVGSSADTAFNTNAAVFYAQYLPSIQKGFFDTQDLQQKARVAQLGADAAISSIAMDALLPPKDAASAADTLKGTPAGVAGGFLRAAAGLNPEEWDKAVAKAQKDNPALALLDPVYSLFWAKVKTLDPDAFEEQMATTLVALLKQGESGIELAKALINIPRSDATFKHRGLSYHQSNHYEQMANAIAIEEDRLNDKALNTPSKLANSLLEKVRPDMTQWVSQLAPTERASALFMFQAAIGTGDVGAFSNLLQGSPEIMREIEDADPGVQTLLLRNAVNEIFSVGAMSDGVQGAVLQSILGDSPTFSKTATLPDILEAFKSGGVGVDINDASLVTALGITKGEQVFTLNSATAAQLATFNQANQREVMEFVTAPTRDEIQRKAVDYYKKVVDDYTEEYGKAPTLPVLQQLTRKTLQDIHYKGFLNAWAKNFEAWNEERNLLNATKEATRAEAVKRRDSGAGSDVIIPGPDAYATMDAFTKSLAAQREQQKAFTPGSPEAEVHADITAEKRTEQSAAFLQAWDKAGTTATDHYLSVRSDNVEVISSLFVPLDRWAVQEWRRNISEGVSVDLLGDPDRYQHSKSELRIKGKREQAKKWHVDITKAFRGMSEWGMTSEEVLNVVNTGFADGQELDGYTLATGRSFLSPAAQSILNKDEDAVPFYHYGTSDPKGPWGINPVKGWKMLSGRMRDETPKATYETSEKQYLLARQQNYIEQASSFLPDHVIPSNFFKVDRMVPLTDLPTNGATRDANGDVTSVNISVIESALNINSQTSAVLAKHYGNPSTSSFYTDQYNTPLMKARYFASQAK